MHRCFLLHPGGVLRRGAGGAAELHIRGMEERRDQWQVHPPCHRTLQDGDEGGRVWHCHRHLRHRRRADPADHQPGVPRHPFDGHRRNHHPVRRQIGDRQPVCPHRQQDLQADQQVGLRSIPAAHRPGDRPEGKPAGGRGAAHPEGYPGTH